MASLDEMKVCDSSGQTSVNQGQPGCDSLPSWDGASASFTAINHGSATFETFAKSRKCRSRESDCQNIYDASEDYAGYKSRKLDFSTLIRSKSTPGVTESQTGPRDADSCFQNSGKLDYDLEAEATQLSTPPKSGKKSFKNTEGENRGNTIAKDRLPEYAITKPLMNLTKWTTTQDTIMTLAISGPTQTTLEKLAAFRYQCSRPELDTSIIGKRLARPAVQRPILNFDEKDPSEEGFVDDIELPTSYQPPNCKFGKRHDLQQNDDFFPGLKVEVGFLQSESSEIAPASPSHIHLAHSVDDDTTPQNELPNASSATTVFQAVIKYNGVENAEMPYTDSRHIPKRFETTYSNDFQTQNFAGFDDDVSPDEFDLMMDSATDYISKQRQESAVQRGDGSTNDEFPFDDEDEIELAQLLLNRSHPDQNSEIAADFATVSDCVDGEGLGLERVLLSLNATTTLPIDHGAKLSGACDSSPMNQVAFNINKARASYVEQQTTIFVNQGPELSSKSNDSRHGVLPLVSQEVVESEKGNEYAPLRPFARPDFPLRVRDRSPIPGVSANLILRTCFRIGEAVRASAECDKSGQDAIIELFARVKETSRQSGTTIQHFIFADLFNDRPPFPKGILENYKIFALQETESSALLGHGASRKMVRCLGRMKQDFKEKGWMFYIINIRSTDWEEVRWTKRIAGAGMV